MSYKFKEKYEDHYIDMLAPVMITDTKVRVFTDDNKFISQDCSHLTKAGETIRKLLCQKAESQNTNNFRAKVEGNSQI